MTEDTPKISHIAENIYPFEVVRGQDVEVYDDLWVTIDLFGDFVGHFRVKDIYDEDHEIIVYNLVREIITYRNRLIDSDPTPLHYVIKYCSEEPVSMPVKEQYEKFKLMKELQ